jgi:aminoglycoside phosphotransferase (APT) family kinase protein
VSWRNTPAAEVDVTADLVRKLLEEQHRDLAGLPVEPLAQGWDNASFRLGTGLVARLPRRELAAALVAHEQRWLGSLAPHLPLPVPAPVRTGRPGLGYPWRWSVAAFLPGRSAANTPPADRSDTARSLGGFLPALHVPAPPIQTQMPDAYGRAADTDLWRRARGYLSGPRSYLRGPRSYLRAPHPYLPGPRSHLPAPHPYLPGPRSHLPA